MPTCLVADGNKNLFIQGVKTTEIRRGWYKDKELFILETLKVLISLNITFKTINHTTVENRRKSKFTKFFAVKKNENVKLFTIKMSQKKCFNV